MKYKGKISYLSIIVLVMAGTIGAGIFFKNKTLSQMAQGDFGIVMATWGVGIFAMLALALALVEVTSAQKTNKGTLEWVMLFTPKWFHKSSTNYMKWIFIPMTMFTMPLYVTNALEDSGLRLGNEMYVLLFSFAILVWFMITNLISLRFAEVSQWISTSIQMVPLLILPIIGFINFGDVSGGPGATIVNKDLLGGDGLTGMSPWLATIAGISAIAFAYDGFYTSASLRNEMRQPKKIGHGLVGGVIGISIVYLFLTIGFNVAGTGDIYGMSKFISPSVFKMFNAFIAIGIMGIVNSYAMSTPREFLVIENDGEGKEITAWHKFIYGKKYLQFDNQQRVISSWSFIFLTSTLFFIILGPIGGYAYSINSYGDIAGTTIPYAGTHLYAFADVLTNYTSLLMFIIISSAVLGAVFNRKTQKVKVEKTKYFLPLAIISVTINYLAGVYMIIDAIVGVTGFNNADVTGNLINLIVFIAIILICIIPGLWSTVFHRNMEKIKA